MHQNQPKIFGHIFSGKKVLQYKVVPGANPADLIRALGTIAATAADQGHPVHQAIDVGRHLAFGLENVDGYNVISIPENANLRGSISVQ